MAADRLAGRRIIVIGAATGIGAATVKRLAAEGAYVCAADINLDGAEATAQAAGGGCFAAPVDIADEACVNAAVDAAVKRLGGLDGAHINAADLRVIFQDSDALAVDLAVFDRTIAVNLRGHLLCTRALLPHLLASGRGAIAYPGSGASDSGVAERPCYAMSKSGLNALMRHVASRWGRQGLTANVVAPGFTMTAELVTGGEVPPALIERFLAEGRSPRLGRSEDLAGMVAMLLSEEGRWINGQVIHINGGALLR
jgi:NAD(P)-dependent dehydrogenase (short-subunit alcohol dehydrogenase family)